MNNEQKMRCLNCGSQLGYMRLKTKEWQCRSCGHTQDLSSSKNPETKKEKKE